jgi:hypothetical protein
MFLDAGMGAHTSIIVGIHWNKKTFLPEYKRRSLLCTGYLGE